jgi:hypothetical protein
MTGKISIFIAPGEGAREEAMRQAIGSDKRFSELQIRTDLVVDLHFRFSGEHETKVLNIELKEPADWVSSVLSGHLMEQTLAMREARQDACTVILGDLGDIQSAIKHSTDGRHLRGVELSHAIAGTHARCKSFRKRSFLNGVPVFYKGDDSGFFDSDDQWADIKELAVDYLTDGSMFGFAIRPAEGEREITAASFLVPGCGPSVMSTVLKEYRLALVPKGLYAKQPIEMKGIGEKRSKDIDKLIVMYYGANQ